MAVRLVGVHDTEKYPEVKRLLGIPEDEPIFILRAKDDASINTLVAYADEAEGWGAVDAFCESITTGPDSVVAFFKDWRTRHPDDCGTPD